MFFYSFTSQIYGISFTSESLLLSGGLKFGWLVVYNYILQATHGTFCANKKFYKIL